MACDECSKCGDFGTPWYFCEVLKGNICIRCYYEPYGDISHEEMCQQERHEENGKEN
jgi:hypothetical protein